MAKSNLNQSATHSTKSVRTTEKKPVWGWLSEIQLSQEMKLKMFVWQIEGGNYGGKLFDIAVKELCEASEGGNPKWSNYKIILVMHRAD